jgi:hypothetical protein
VHRRARVQLWLKLRRSCGGKDGLDAHLAIELLFVEIYLGVMATTGNQAGEGEKVPDRLFENGIELAKSYGYGKKIESASHDASFMTDSHLVICDLSGSVIVRLSRSLCEGLNSKSDRAKAIAWARSMGYPVPQEPNGCLSGILIAIGLLIFIVPGVMIMIWVAYTGQVYQKEMNALVARWVDAGKPEPGRAKNLDKKLESSEQLQIQSKIKEYKVMLEEGLISEEEYESLRKKALGL